MMEQGQVLFLYKILQIFFLRNLSHMILMEPSAKVEGLFDLKDF
jgi:hypothetical protein